MKHCLLILGTIILLSSSSVAQTKSISKTPFTIGETISFESDELNEQRALNIYLPASYSKSKNRHYPVIYLLDGSRDEDFIHIAGLVQFGSFSWIKMLPESIVVGIANVDRRRDFTYPSKSERDRKQLPTSGGSAKFMKMLEREVKPLVEKNYRTKGQGTLIGQSLGGLVATEILFTKPDLFEHYIIVSPSLWWDNESLLKRKPKSFAGKKKIAVAVGKEGEVMKRVAKSLAGKLQRAYGGKAQVGFKYYDRLDHGDTLHLAVYDAFEMMFRVKK